MSAYSRVYNKISQYILDLPLKPIKNKNSIDLSHKYYTVQDFLSGSKCVKF